MKQAIVFDGAAVRDCRLDFQQTQHHSEHLDYHYQRARDMGMTRVRDSAWLDFTAPRKGVLDCRYLDRLARHAETVELWVEFQHYNWPRWLSEADILAGAATDAFAQVAEQLARQYAGVFAGWLPCVELGFWTCQLADGHWHPLRPMGWWDWYKLTSALAVRVAHALRAGDPACKLAMSEPYGIPGMRWEDQARPFDTLLGRPDAVAEANGCHTWQQGSPGLLDEIGLNAYHPLELHAALADARGRYPGKQVVLAETGHVMHQWISKETWFALCADAGAEVACWGPGGPFRDFSTGEFIGGTLI